MSEHRFRLRRGDFEVEFAGDRDFVEAQIARWAGDLGEAPAHPEAAPGLPVQLSEAVIPRVPDTFQPKVNVSLAEFVRMKEARAPLDVLVVAAYYMEKYLRKERYTPGELGAQLSPLEAWACQDLGDQLELALAQGYFDALRDGAYTLTYKGQTYVRNGLVHD